MTGKTLETLVAGDEVAVVRTSISGSGRRYVTLVKVERTTKTKVCVAGQEFDRAGNMFGNKYARTHLVLVTDEVRNEVATLAEIAKLQNALKALEAAQNTASFRTLSAEQIKAITAHISSAVAAAGN